MPLFTSFAFPTSDANTIGHARTLPTRLSEIKNVRDFGATGNGVTDDWNAIMAAVNWPRITLLATASNLRASFTGVVASATFTGAISGTTLTVSGVTGTISIGQTVTGGTAGNTRITAGSGTSWTVSISQTVISQAMGTNCILTTSSVGGSPIAVGDMLLNNGGTSNTVLTDTSILSQQSGTGGGAGVYIISRAQNFTSQAMLTASETIQFASVPSGPIGNANVINLDNASFSAGFIPGFETPEGPWTPTLKEVTPTSITVAYVGGIVNVGDRIQIDPTDRGTIYFPPGTYYVSAPINFGVLGAWNTLPYIRFVGEMGATTIVGDFADYVFYRGHRSGARASGGHYIEKFTIINRHASGGGIRLGYAEGGYIRDCDITANIAINDDNTEVYIDGGNVNGSFETHVLNCNCRPFNLRATGSIGCYKLSSGPVTNCTFIGFDIGMATTSGQGASTIHGCYFEGNNTGFACGYAIEAWYNGGGGVLTLSGCHFKNNGIAMGGGGGCTYEGIKIEAATGSIPGDPQYGIRIGGDTFFNTKFQGVSVTGDYQQAGICIVGGEVARHLGVMIAAGSTNSVSSPTKNWILPTTASTALIKHCNVPSVYNEVQLPARTGTIISAAWSGGTATIHCSLSGFMDINNWNSQPVTIAVSGVTLTGYNGTFAGTFVTTTTGGADVTIQYSVANPGGPSSGGTILFYITGTVLEGMTFNIRNANTATWGGSAVGGGSTHAKVKFIPNKWSVQGV